MHKGYYRDVLTPLGQDYAFYKYTFKGKFEIYL